MKQKKIPQLFYVIRAYDASGEILKAVPCYGETKEDAVKEKFQAEQHLWHLKGCKDVRAFWAHEKRQE